MSKELDELLKYQTRQVSRYKAVRDSYTNESSDWDRYNQIYDILRINMLLLESVLNMEADPNA